MGRRARVHDRRRMPFLAYPARPAPAAHAGREAHAAAVGGLALMADPTGTPLEAAGVRVVTDFVTPEEEQALAAALDARPWEPLRRRRVQHYGRRFVYGANSVDPAEAPQRMPDFLRYARRPHSMPASRAEAAPQRPPPVPCLRPNVLPGPSCAGW